MKHTSNNAAGNGLIIKTHRRFDDKSTSKTPPVVASIRQCTLFPKKALKAVAYRIWAVMEGRTIRRRAEWDRGIQPPAEFVALGRQVGLLA